jgi:hypothetical protein
MSTRQVSDRNDPVIESRDQLVEPMAKGEKPRERLADRHRARESWSIAPPITTPVL